MFCSYCGKKLPEDSLFCVYCGKQQPEKEVAPVTQSVWIEDPELEQVAVKQETVEQEPAPVRVEKKRKKWLLPAVAAVAAVAVIGLLLYLFLPRTYYLPVYVRTAQNGGDRTTTNEYDYDDDGRLIRFATRTRYGNEVTTDQVITYKYDSDGCLKSATVKWDDEVIATVKYTFRDGILEDVDVDCDARNYDVSVDKDGHVNKVKVTDPDDPDATTLTYKYKYHENGRVKERDYSYTGNWSYRTVTRYDEEGRLLEQINYQQLSSEELEEVYNMTYEYDEKGNLCCLHQTSGDVEMDFTIKYTYKGSRIADAVAVLTVESEEEDKKVKMEVALEVEYDGLEGEIAVEDVDISGDTEEMGEMGEMEDMEEALEIIEELVIEFEVNKDGKLVGYAVIADGETVLSMETEFEKVSLPRTYHIPYFNDPIWINQM